MFRIGWWVLVILTALLALNHVVAAALVATSGDERALFLTTAALNLVTLVVLMVPYRARERWAWWVVWIPIAVVFVGPSVFGLDAITTAYLVVGAVMVIAQLVTQAAMRSASRIV